MSVLVDEDPELHAGCPPFVSTTLSRLSPERRRQQGAVAAEHECDLR